MKNIIQELHKIHLNSSQISQLSLEKRNKIISEIWYKIIEEKDKIKSENKKDLDYMTESNPMYDRLILTDSRIESMAQWCFDLVKISDPLKKYEIEKTIFTNDWLEIKKIWVPMWVVACIYEARPNVTIDLAIMCIKSWNAVVLRWWSQAKFSNIILIEIIKNVFTNNWIDDNLIYNFPLEREKLDILYKSTQLVDLIIPRWWKWLINSVREKSLVPVIETWAWVVHLYIDDKINPINYDKAIDIVINSKVSRPSVCNALDTLIINKNINKEFMNSLFNKLIENNVVLLFENNCDYNKEQLSLELNIKYVDNLKQAISHIKTYSSKHSDWILSDNQENIFKFNNQIDSSVVYTNTSTRFSDWSCFWFWWEIWISTQKLHARWPMWSEALVTYKYKVISSWATRK